MLSKETVEGAIKAVASEGVYVDQPAETQVIAKALLDTGFIGSSITESVRPWGFPDITSFDLMATVYFRGIRDGMAIQRKLDAGG